MSGLSNISSTLMAVNGFNTPRAINADLSLFFTLGDFDDCQEDHGNAQNVLNGAIQTTLGTVVKLITFYIKSKMLWQGSQENVIRQQQGRSFTRKYMRADDMIRDAFGDYFVETGVNIDNFTHREFITIVKAMTNLL